MAQGNFQKLVNNSFLFRLFLLRSLPMAYFAGVRVKSLSDDQAVATVKFGWMTQNPFKSMYFACQAMAAELTTGLLVMNGIYGSTPPVSMLIIKNEAVYHKKAVGKITFTCTDGAYIAGMIEKAKQGGEGVIIELKSTGTNQSNEIVSEFTFTWSLKAKVK